MFALQEEERTTESTDQRTTEVNTKNQTENPEDRNKDCGEEQWDKWIPRRWESSPKRKPDEMDTSLGENSIPEEDRQRALTPPSTEPV